MTDIETLKAVIANKVCIKGESETLNGLDRALVGDAIDAIAAEYILVKKADVPERLRGYVERWDGNNFSSKEQLDAFANAASLLVQDSQRKEE